MAKRAERKKIVKRAVEEMGCACAPYVLSREGSENYVKCGMDCYAPAEILLEDGEDAGSVLCTQHFVRHAVDCKAAAIVSEQFEKMAAEEEAELARKKAEADTRPCDVCGGQRTNGKCSFINHRQIVARFI